MIPFLTAILWDTAAARALLLTVVAGGGAYFMTPSTRTWYERLAPAAAAALGVGAASAPSGRSREVEAELAALRAEIDAMRGASKPGP